MLLEMKKLTVKQFKEMADSPKYALPPSLADDAAAKNWEAIETSFWKNLSYGEPPNYGADMSGSLFDPDMNIWNLNQLDTMLHRLMNERELPGVLSAYLYFGMWRAFFGIHIEDMNLFSINYLHFGAPKHWYAVGQASAQRIESLAEGQYPQLYRDCHEFLRHKNTMVAPTVLMRESIPVSHTVQEEGQYVITFPHGYHWGFNQGFNCAEATNFATEHWLPFGDKAKWCKCIDDAVRIDMPTLRHRLKLFKQGVPNFKSYDPVQTSPPELPEARVGRMGGGRMKSPGSRKDGNSQVDTGTIASRAKKKTLAMYAKFLSFGTPECPLASPTVGVRRRAAPMRSEAWKFFCACGEAATSNPTPGSKISASSFPRGGRCFACGTCGAWSHIDCYVDHKGKTIKSLPEVMACHQCRGDNFWQLSCLCGQRWASDHADARQPGGGEIWQCVGCRM
jgi:hypothetical protein